MNELETLREDPDIISAELGIPKNDILSYFKNYYINRTLPIRNLTMNEINLVKQYKEIMYYSEHDMKGMCQQFNVDFNEYIKDRWLVPKAYINMPDREYYVAKKYYRLLLEPYFNYDNHRAPMLRPLSMEEVIMLLSNLAVGISIIPGDKITSFISLTAMDRLVGLYDTLPKENNEEANDRIRELSPEQLVAVIDEVTKPKRPVVLTRPKKEPKSNAVKK